MKSVLLVFALVMIIGCGSTSNIASYRPRGSNEAAWKVKVEQNNLTKKVEISVNDSVVCEGSVGVFNTDEDMKGDYRGHHVTANLSRTQSFMKEGYRCEVFIDGELVGKFDL